jgi:type II secretory pathway pseudopilin PulG
VRETGAAAFNTLATCILIAILISAGMSYYLQVVRVARETALRYELASIRTAIVLFTALNRRPPESLQELTARQYLLPDAEYTVAAGPIALESRSVFKRSYLEPSSVDNQGQVLDPFGQPYRYDPRAGRVSVADKRYERW